MLLVLFLVAIFSLLFFFLLPNHKTHKKLNLPPGPKGLPILGNIHQVDPLTPHLYYANLAKIYGPILSLRFGQRSAVVIQSASLAKEVLRTQDHNLCNRADLVAHRRVSYNRSDVIFAPYNECFRELRKICVVHLFSSKKVKASYPIRREEVSGFIQKISALSSASKDINLSELLMILTSSITCRISFGKRYDDEGVERSRFHDLLNELQAVCAAFFCSDYFPYVGFLIDKFNGMSSRLEKIHKNCDKFYEDVINEHLDPNKPKSDYEDIVDVLLQLKKERCFSFELTLDHIKALLMNIIAAGTDTSAAMVVWAMSELTKHPVIMKKVQHELRSMIGDQGFVEENELPKLKYFKAVVKETFRLHPAAPLLLVHEAIHKCSVQGYDILPKTLVFVNAWAIGRDPQSWTDPELFMPDRFLESSINLTGHDFELIPFGSGRRMCPGILVGLANFELVLANMLYTFDWTLPTGMSKDDIDFDVIPGVTMHKKTPLTLMAEKWTP